MNVLTTREYQIMIKKEKEKEKKTKNDRKLNSFTGNELCSASLLITKHKEPQRQTNEEHCNKHN